MNNQKIVIAITILLFLASIYYLSYHVSQSEFEKILLGFTTSFAIAYWLIVKGERDSYLSLLVIIGSFIPLAAFPSLSDDIYRFMWDGYLLVDGVSPFRYLPSDYVKLQDIDPWYAETLPLLNSPDYFSIYPIVDQVIYFVSALFSKIGLPFHITMKLIYILIHLSGFWAAKKVLHQQRYGLYLYYLNPLVIIEGVGNLHAEVIMVGFLSLSIWLMNINRWFSASFLFAIAVHTKLTPLMILPFIIIYLYKKREYAIILWTLALILLGFVPLFFNQDFFAFLSSIDLYFRKFEFNGGIYNLLKWLGQILLGYNPISVVGPLLAGVIFSYLTYRLYTFYLKQKSNEHDKEYSINDTIFHWAAPILLIHLLLSTTVHPWYLITLLYLNAYQHRFSVFAWSYLITLTYINYHHGVYHENLCIIGLEYLTLFVIFFIDNQIKKKTNVALSTFYKINKFK